MQHAVSVDVVVAEGVAEGALLASPDRVLLVVDWDNTVLPTTWLQAVCGLGANEPPLCASPLDAAALAALATLDGVAAEFMRVATERGTLVIVTNAEDRYVAATAAAFLPRTAAVLALMGVYVMSARDWYAPLFPAAVAEWKMRAFRDVVSGWRACHNGALPSQLVSVGDSTYERAAAHALAHTAGVRNVKTIKVGDALSADDLASALACVVAQLDGVLARCGDVDLVCAHSDAALLEIQVM